MSLCGVLIMHKFVLSFIIIAVALAIIIVDVYFFIKKKRKPSDNLSVKTDIVKIKSADESTMMIQPSLETLSLVEKIEIDNRSGHKLTLLSLDPRNSLSSKKYQEITARGSAIGASLTQGAMPFLAQAQTLAQILKAAPNGLFTATAPLSELMKYKDGTVGSIVMKGGKLSSHAGFQEIVLTAANPAAVIGAGMQAMAMISGQYYMDKISKQLDGIEHGIERLIGFHHDENIGKLRSIENRMREIVNKTHVDDTDIITLQSGIRDADSILIEYSSRLERLSKTGEITEIQVRRLRSRISAAKELQNLRANTEEHELYYSFQICLFASKLILESKKAEFATRMKTGETEKAMEAFESFNVMFQQSFVNNATDFLDALYKPINAKAEFLKQRQWVESKKSKQTLQSFESKKAELKEQIDLLIEGCSDDKMIHSFKDDCEVLYLPASDESEQRVFISVNE